MKGMWRWKSWFRWRRSCGEELHISRWQDEVVKRSTYQNKDIPENKAIFEISGDPACGFSPSGRTCLGLIRM